MAKWTNEEIDRLTDYRDYLTNKEIAELLGRSLSSIEKKVSSLGLTRRVVGKDYSNARYKHFKTLEYSHTVSGHRYYDAICDCGKEFKVSVNRLNHRQQESCGCMQNGRASHGHCESYTRSPEYYSWSGMKQRCNNPNNERYSDYGGRGIKHDVRWSDFREFYKDMGERPDGKTLDRIDVNGDYNKDNCRWATNSEQNKNRRWGSK